MPRGDPFDTVGFDIGSDVGISATLGIMSNLPGFRSVDGKGSAKQVANLTARDAIPDQAVARDAVTQLRQEGMTCFVQSTQRTYQLQGGITNADWVDITSPSSVGSKTRDSDDTGTIEVGSVLCQSPTTNLRVQRANPAANDALSRPVGVATAQQTTQGNPVTLQTVQGESVAFRLRPGLAPTRGEELILSTVIGDSTIPGSGVSEPASGQQIQRVGVILDLLTYDGAGDLLVLAQVDFTNRRTAS